MGYLENKPNGKLYIGNVKWNGDYTHTMLFSSKSARDNFMKSNLSLIKSNVIQFNPNDYIDVDTKIDGIDEYNYVYYVDDSDISTRPYCCFIINYEYISPRTTRIYISLDIVQYLIYDTTFYKSMIIRGHIPKSEDVINKWLAPEPVGTDNLFYKNIALTSYDWTPIYCIHSTSKPIDNGEGIITDFEYGGSAYNDNYSGEFVIPITNIQKAQEYAKMWAKDLSKAFDVDWTSLLTHFLIPSAAQFVSFNAAEFFDHSSDVIGVFCRPKWCINDMTNPTPEDKEISFSYSIGGTLANGYTPKNNKLYSSLANCYQIYNRNGFRFIIKPELLKTTSISFKAICNAYDKSAYKLVLNNYTDESQSTHNISYNATTSIVTDTNVGINKLTNVITSLLGTGASVGASVGGIMSGNPMLTMSGASGVISGASSVFDAVNNKPVKVGSQGEILGIQPYYQELHLEQISPSYEECVAIDNYLSLYGYAINETDDVVKYFNSRSNWNYVQLSNVNLRCKAPTNYEIQLKNILESGITFWHNYDTFGDYTQANN